MTPSTDQTLHEFANLFPTWTLLPIVNSKVRRFHRTLQRVRLANKSRLLLRTPSPVPFWTYICSNVETIFIPSLSCFRTLNLEIPWYLYFASVGTCKGVLVIGLDATSSLFSLYQGSVPEMCIWPILLIQSDIKLCMHL